MVAEGPGRGFIRVSCIHLVADRLLCSLMPDSVPSVGCTPPPAKYFSFRSYLVNRGKDIVAAAMGEMTNHLVINATGPDAPFNALTTMVTTADGRTLAGDRCLQIRLLHNPGLD